MAKMKFWNGTAWELPNNVPFALGSLNVYGDIIEITIPGFKEGIDAMLILSITTSTKDLASPMLLSINGGTALPIAIDFNSVGEYVHLEAHKYYLLSYNDNESAWIVIGGFHDYGKLKTQGASFTLPAVYHNKVVQMTGSSAQVITIPPESTAYFPEGSQITVLAVGSGAVTFSPGSGVTLRSKDSKRTIDGQYASATLIKTSVDTWTLIGALKA